MNLQDLLITGGPGADPIFDRLQVCTNERSNGTVEPLATYCIRATMGNLAIGYDRKKRPDDDIGRLVIFESLFPCFVALERSKLNPGSPTKAWAIGANRESDCC